ncbi:MAG: sensor domain-containing diguanylate cyclase [Gammaproteobacteria bacterium]|nr:sensor domain-containing diguanylate cyclase [Gammaproteobacteria bacterium]
MAEAALTHELMTHIADHSPCGVLVVSDKGTIQFCNETLGDFLGVEAQSLVGNPDSMVFDQFEGNSDTPNMYHITLLPQIRRPQRWLSAERMTFPVEGTAGLSSVEVIYFRDITELKRMKTDLDSLNRQLEDTIPTDPVTGLMNRRTLFQALEPQVSRSRRYSNPLSVLVMTVTSYHCEPENVATTRDQMLLTVSNFLRDQVRWVDIAGRTGEQEFTLVLPETNKADAEKLGAKLQNRLASTELMDSPNTTICMELHIGITSWHKGDDTRLLLQRVYRALDDAKEAPQGKISVL